MSHKQSYPGKELLIFEKALNWKKYFSAALLHFIKGNVLEAGAGIGANTPFLNDGSAARWVLLEPDENFVIKLNDKIKNGLFNPNCMLLTGTITQTDNIGKFDTIIYIDVLEHIANDKAELTYAAALLNPGGYLIVLTPAFQFLYSPFDKAIGHFRRYNIRGLSSITPPSLQPVKIRYLDSMGFFASLVNRVLLKQSYPSLSQVMFWDKFLIPVSRITDRLFNHFFGKSVIGIWKIKN